MYSTIFGAGVSQPFHAGITKTAEYENPELLLVLALQKYIEVPE